MSIDDNSFMELLLKRIHIDAGDAYNVNAIRTMYWSVRGKHISYSYAWKLYDRFKRIVKGGRARWESRY